MSRERPVTAEDAIALVEKRRRQARAYYRRLKEDARRYREAQQDGESLPAADEPTKK